MSSFQVAYRGDILVLQHLKKVRKFLLTVFKFDKKTKQFVKQGQNYLNLSISGHDIKVLQLSCIVEGATGLKQPCLLVEQLNSELDATIHFFFLMDHKTLTQVATFRHRELALCQHVLLSDGPSISWLNNDKIHFLQWNSNSHNLEYTSHFYPARLKSECLALLWSGTGTDGELLSVAHSSRECIILAGAKNGFLSSDKIVPSIYSSIATCLYVSKYGNSYYSNASFQQTNTQVHYLDVYVGTSRCQLIRFTAGKLVSHCQLPFDDPSHIEIIQAGNDSNYVIVQSKQRNVCLIKPPQNKLLNEWSNKYTVLIDDFLENGTEQVCLLQDNADIGNMFKGYVLSNLNGVSIASDQEHLTGECSLSQVDQSNIESIQSTIQALRTRLQACNAHLYEVRTECNDKKTMIDNTCKTLCRIAGLHVSQTKTNINSSNLVSLIGDETDEEKQDECKQQSSEFTHNAIWQRVIADKWVIGVDFECHEKSNISDVSLSLVSCTKDYLKSSCHPIFGSQSSRALMLVPKDEILVPSSKRQKLDNALKPNACMVTMVTTLPTFYKGAKVTGMVALSWTRRQDDEVASRHIICCGYVHLDMDQVISGDLSISGKMKEAEDTKRDLIALKAISIQTMLSFNQISTPSNMVHVLRKELGLVPVGDITSGESQEILFNASDIIGLLEGVAVLVDCSTDHGEIRLFTRNLNQVYITINRLRHALPADVTIQVNQAVNGSSDYQSLCRIQNQLDHLTSEIQTTLLNKQRTLSKDLNDVKCNVTKLGKIRSTFEERRKVFSYASRHLVKKL